MLLPFTQVAEIACLTMAFRFLKKEKETYWWHFKWFMAVTVTVEIVGHVLLMTDTNNHWLYNIYLPIEMAFKYYLLHKICGRYFKVVRISTPFLVLTAGLYIYECFATGLKDYSIWSNSVGSVGIFAICCLYFYYFLRKEEYVDIYKHAPFWIITGLFFFYLGSTACNVFFKYLASIYVKYQIPVRFIIYSLLNFLFYGCWSYSFICRYRNTTSSSS